MKAIEALERDHRVIEQVASACGLCAEALRGGAKVPTDVLESIVDFFHEYGDRYHRQEEEVLLAPAQTPCARYGAHSGLERTYWDFNRPDQEVDRALDEAQLAAKAQGKNRVVEVLFTG